MLSGSGPRGGPDTGPGRHRPRPARPALREPAHRRRHGRHVAAVERAAGVRRGRQQQRGGYPRHAARLPDQRPMVLTTHDFGQHRSSNTSLRLACMASTFHMFMHKLTSGRLSSFSVVWHDANHTPTTMWAHPNVCGAGSSCCASRAWGCPWWLPRRSCCTPACPASRRARHRARHGGHWRPPCATSRRTTPLPAQPTRCVLSTCQNLKARDFVKRVSRQCKRKQWHSRMTAEHVLSFSQWTWFNDLRNVELST